MDVYVQRERCNRINDNLAKPRGGDYWTGWKKIRKEKRVGARHRATDKRLSIREEIGSSRLRPLSKYTVTQYWHASLVKMLCVYKHIIYIYNFTKIKQRYWIVSIHIPGDRNVIYHLFESRKNTKESRVRNLGRFNFGKNCKKRREKEKNDGRQTGSRLCLLWKSRDTFSRKKEKKKLLVRVDRDLKIQLGREEVDRSKGPVLCQGARVREGKKGDARVSADWMGGIARFLPNPGDLWHKFADRRQRERRDRAKGRQKRKRREMLSRRFLVNVAVKEGKEGGEKEFLRNQSSRDRELIIDQIYGIIVNQIMRF